MLKENMFKDEITPELKKRFLEEIRIAKTSGKERGLFLCKDDKGNITTSKPCEGEECIIGQFKLLEDPFAICPEGLKGDIHIESYISTIKKEYQKERMVIPPDNVLRERIIEDLKHKHEEKQLGELSAISPSYLNTVNSILFKCYRNTETVTCAGSDLEEDKIECWTPKKDIRKGQCIRALYDQRRITTKKEKLFPKKWIVPLFDKEIISLK